ncbi:hypothetical protein [Castellaniella caeni]|uniref:hypothetical protein n=1 Tax=Castellaniella caeni TaxID=266123 RepID=UPI0008352F47|nr:hypothetical protein [Castellaniella caeni]
MPHTPSTLSSPCQPARQHRGRILRRLLAPALLASLSACAGIGSTAPGTPLTQIEAHFGAPTLQCTDRNGQARAIWSQQPLGQYAWGGTLDAAGRIEAMQPILTDEHFQVLKQGTWTPEQVRCEFGPPAFIDSVGLPGTRQVVWNYRYRQDHVWNSLMFVYFGQDGSHVTRFHPGPDPLYDPDRMPGR